MSACLAGRQQAQQGQGLKGQDAGAESLRKSHRTAKSPLNFIRTLTKKTIAKLAFLNFQAPVVCYQSERGIENTDLPALDSA